MSFWPLGDPVSDVETEAGRPTCFTWQGQMHPVTAIANVWRIDDAWWQQRIWHDNFKLITATGLLLILTHDLVQDTWHVRRVYD
jgi:hypothetical protein